MIIGIHHQRQGSRRRPRRRRWQRLLWGKVLKLRQHSDCLRSYLSCFGTPRRPRLATTTSSEVQRRRQGRRVPDSGSRGAIRGGRSGTTRGAAAGVSSRRVVPRQPVQRPGPLARQGRTMARGRRPGENETGARQTRLGLLERPGVGARPRAAGTRQHPTPGTAPAQDGRSSRSTQSTYRCASARSPAGTRERPCAARIRASLQTSGRAAR